MASNIHQAHGKWGSMEQIRDEQDIQVLSVLELKQILTANFIDYRGCCEKKELIDKVKMLYHSERKTEKGKPSLSGWRCYVIAVIISLNHEF